MGGSPKDPKKPVVDALPDRERLPKRRQLLKLMGLGAGATATGAYASSTMADITVVIGEKTEITIYRPEDLLYLKLTYAGFRPSADRKYLQRVASPGLLTVAFEPQSIAEEAFEESAGNSGNWWTPGRGGNQPPSLPAQTYVSGDSRLVFSIPASIQRISLTAEALLDWDRFKLEVSKRAASPKVMPAFSAEDLRVGNYSNPSFDAADARVVNPQKPPAINLPDERQRQADLNRNIRGATRNERDRITVQQAPTGVIATNPSTVAAVAESLRYGKTPRPPDPEETCIEMPYRLFISPNEYGAWYHEHKLKWFRAGEMSLSSTVELWHTRLTCRDCTGGKDLSEALRPIRSVRALWASDVSGDHTRKPVRDERFRTALYNDDRHCIVHETSNWALPNRFVPKAVMVNNLMLSTLGGWLDAELNVPIRELEEAGLTGTLNLTKWKHIATLARDHYVEVVYAGNLHPFGHEASLVRITERKPEQGYALNRQRQFLVLNEVEMKYDTHDRRGAFQSFNLSTIRFVTTHTPSLDGPGKFHPDIPGNNDHQFVPRVGGKDFQFKLLAFDLEGNEVDFEMPLVFVSKNVTRNANGSLNTSNINKINDRYNKQTGISGKASLRNQLLALARSQTSGDTTFEVSSILFNGQAATDEAAGFRPSCKEIEIFIHAVENITGKREPQKVELVDDESHKPEGSRKNKSGVFAKLLVKAAVSFAGSGNKTGGAMSPDFSISGLSKKLGAIGGEIEDALKGEFNPEKFFDQAAKLFGVIDLGKIIQGIQNAAMDVVGEKIQSAFPALKNIETKEAHITQYTWNAATLKEQDFGPFKFKPKAKNATGKLLVDTRLYRYKDPSRSNLLSVDSHIDDFQVEIASVAAVRFKRVGFKVDTSIKADFTVDMEKEPLKFLGALSFINDLQRFIPADGFSDPPFLDITPSGVTAGYTLGLPDVQVGIFSLRHMSMGAKVRLPFDGSPLTLRFNFCEKQQPFTLTVSALGGGGFFAMELDMKGLRSIEAALEFGAAVSLNLGVASGAVSVMGGIYFKMVATDGQNEYTLEGYLRINGALSVLGLITVSVEFMMVLVAEMTGDKVERVWGEAKLKVKVEVFMFSKTVSMKVQREFAGAGADPTFAMLISDNEWREYCASFAA